MFTQKELVFLPDKQLRGFLADFAMCNGVKGVVDASFQKLMKGLRAMAATAEVGAPGAAPGAAAARALSRTLDALAIRSEGDEGGGGGGGKKVWRAPSEFRNILSSLSTGYTMAAVLPPRLLLNPRDDVEGDDDGDEPVRLVRLVRLGERRCLTVDERMAVGLYWPAARDCMNQATECRGCLPGWFADLVVAAVGTAMRVTNDDYRYPDDADDDDADVDDDDNDKSGEFGFWGPGLPRCRRLRAYLADRGRQPSKVELGRACHKAPSIKADRTPGIFAGFCKHGVCLFFQLMNRFEGPRTGFEILLTRFETPPGLVVYDNACNLQYYVDRREPHLFSGTIFRIDGFHSGHHRTCPRECSARAYAEDFEFFHGAIAGLNSQVAEQANSKLELLRKSCSWMTETNFYGVVRFFVSRTNALLLRKM